MWLLVISCAVQAEVELSDQARANFGITTTVATAAQVTRQWQAMAQVLDAAPLVTTLAESRAAQAAALASSAELQRLEALYKADNVALKVVEAARAQTVSDQSRVQTVQAQLLGSWGRAISRMSATEREQLAQAVLAGKQILIRAELAGNAPGSLTVYAVRLQLPDNNSVNATLLGSMPLSNIQAVGKAYLLSAATTAEVDLQPGEVLTAELQDAARPVSGIQLPRAAVIRWQGQQWAYVEQSPGHYQRVALSIVQWSEQGALVNTGVKAGDKVVTTGASLLLGAELAPAGKDE
jgi:hypothetical protein